MGAERRDIKTKIVGLTGSIGSGKSHILELFAAEGIHTASSDKHAHGLLEGEVFAEVSARFPSAFSEGKIDRKKLGAEVFANPEKKKILESILHPLVRIENLKFAAGSGQEFVVIEIPLLFESGAENYCDYVIAINVSRETMLKRAMQRDAMTEQKFNMIYNAQMLTEEKLKRADFEIDNEDEHDTVGQVRKIIEHIKEKIN